MIMGEREASATLLDIRGIGIWDLRDWTGLAWPQEGIMDLRPKGLPMAILANARGHFSLVDGAMGRRDEVNYALGLL